MAREKCGLHAVPRTAPVSRVVTRTLRKSILQSHSRVKHIPPSLSTDVWLLCGYNHTTARRMVPAYTKCDVQLIKVAPDGGLI